MNMMRRSLTLKLTLTFLAVSLAGVVLVAVWISMTTSVEFSRLVLDRQQADFIAAAEAYYQLNGSWPGVQDALIKQGLIPPIVKQGGGHADPRNPFALVDKDGYVVIDGGPFHSGDFVPSDLIQQGTVVTVGGQRAGTVLSTGSPPNRNPIEDRYLARTNQALIAGALGAGGLALLLGIILARSVTRPLRELTRAAHALAAGQLGHQVTVRSQDELGELSATFNKMSADLEQSNRLRRQMTADIAHDLRTPLSVITGYLESLRDGVLKPTPERYDTLFSEARQLQRLVEDLRTLSLADAGELPLNRQAVEPGELLADLAQAFENQAGQQRVRLTVKAAPDLPEIEADPERIEQVLGNLVSNALRYTPENGEIILRAAGPMPGNHSTRPLVSLEVQDNGAGIDPEVLPHIFERFYRGDDSRQEEGSGLGLAIARSIVELHGGKISATSAGPGQGSTFTVQLPVRQAGNPA